MIVLLTTADTEVLATARARDTLPSDFPAVRAHNPTSTDVDVDALVDDADVVLVRLLGGRRAWPDGFDRLATRCAETGTWLLAFSGEATPDAELTAASTAPDGVVADAFEYLVQGGVANTAQLLRFVSDTLLTSGFGFDPPHALADHGVHGSVDLDPDKPTVGVVFYRTHWMSGNTGFVDTLCDEIRAAGANALAVFAYSLRPDADGRVPAVDEHLAGAPGGGVDAVVLTVLAMGARTGGNGRSEGPAAGGRKADGTTSERADPGADGGWAGEWEVPALTRLDVPVVQGITSTSTRAGWAASDNGLSPLDTAMQVAVPEFDGRIVGVPFSFKETSPEGVPCYVADPERAARVAGLATRLARLGHTPPEAKRVAVVLSNYPTKHARIGNAVGLDTPASAVRVLDAMTAAGYETGGWAARTWSSREPDEAGEDSADDGGTPSDDGQLSDGDALFHRLIAAGGFDREFLTPAQLAANPARLPAQTYGEWFAELPGELQQRVTAAWGPPPGELYVHPRADGESSKQDLCFAILEFGNVVLGIQPPRGFGENPVAIYHDPDLAPTHHYLAFYWWLDRVWGADAVVHLGKHGTLEWLPGKGLGLGADCAPDAVLGDLPLFYPFVVNDPGEGTQAKRRAHATLVDHLVPPMTRAESYDELTRLEVLLDEYAQIQAMDPAKEQAMRGEIWQLVRSSELARDLGWDETEPPEDFDDRVVDLDGYLCEIKDSQIRGGLHLLGQAPAGESRLGLVLAILRLPQGQLPGLRAAIGAVYGLDEQNLLAQPGVRLPADTAAHPDVAAAGLVTASDAVDWLEAHARGLAEAMEAKGWEPEAAESVTRDQLGHVDTDVARVLAFAAREVVPRLDATEAEIDRLLDGLAGGYLPSGPSGSPTRGRADVLPTGKNFYAVDPKALPSELAWQVGQRLADDLIARYLDETGDYPASVGIVVWGTAAMRTHGDDIAEILALLGVRPVWNPESRRVTGLELMSPEELGRPRVDVTVRISGFFRDAFPHLVRLVDDAVAMVADLDEPAETNPLAAHAAADVADGADPRRATARVFGSKPGAYGAGLLPLIDAQNWQTDADLAEVYAAWGGYAYGRDLDGAEARTDMERAFSRMSVAVKNTDTREHDLFDSDDYFQYHGGMIAAVRSLTGEAPKAYVGDSADPGRVTTRDLAGETARVFRARVANPKWIEAMTRHGYKGAFELSATVDYLFGYDATAGVVEDWMYETLAQRYVLDDDIRAFTSQSNPWALRAMTERLLEAADRGLWENPDDATLERLRRTELETEGDLEDRA